MVVIVLDGYVECGVVGDLFGGKLLVDVLVVEILWFMWFWYVGYDYVFEGVEVVFGVCVGMC